MTKVIYRIYILLVFLPIFLVLTILTALITALGCWVGAVRIFSYYPGKIWSRITLALLFCPVKIKGKEHFDKHCPSLVTPNHTSALDIFLMYGYMGVPFKWVMKGSLRKIPFVGWACEKCGFIFVDTSTPAGAKQVVEDAMSAIRSGYHIFIFPEGTRTLDGKLGRLKKGAFVMAQETGAPVVPVTIKGGFEAFSRLATFPTPRRLTLEIFPAIDSTTYSKDARGLIQLTGDVQNILREHLS